MTSRRYGGYLWMAGDHHVHTQYSADGRYRVIDHVRQARAHGLDWMVITDHGGVEHAKIGVERVHPDIVAAREAHPDLLLFQGLEWNIPGAEHGSVFVHPGPGEVEVLKDFENCFDGNVTQTTDASPVNEALAVHGLGYLAGAVQEGRVADALFLANHPSRRGLDSPHKLRAWRDAEPRIAVGMEGAPGHQAASLPLPEGPGWHRGYYSIDQTQGSFPGYPPESYRTFGGFDWMTATVGGVWDSLLAEGKPWWITVNSDSHNVYTDSAVPGPDSCFERDAYNADPVRGPVINLKDGDHWPGQYGCTMVGAADFSHRAVMDGIRAGRTWVCHGGLISALDARLRSSRAEVPLGGTLLVDRGGEAELVIEITPALGPNWAQFVPRLARVDVVQGVVTGPSDIPDAQCAPLTRTVESFEVGRPPCPLRLSYRLGPVDEPLYVRLRGTDGNRCGPGSRGPQTDPAGPVMDVFADTDPWGDLWFYSNPMWVLPR